jgi:hypothetical protein
MAERSTDERFSLKHTALSRMVKGLGSLYGLLCGEASMGAASNQDGIQHAHQNSTLRVRYAAGAQWKACRCSSWARGQFCGISLDAEYDGFARGLVVAGERT